MISAFGIEHTQVSKAYGMGAVTGALKKIGTKVASGTASASTKTGEFGIRAGSKSTMKASMQGLKGASQMYAHPLATGAATVGAGALGAGAVGAGIASRKKNR